MRPNGFRVRRDRRPHLWIAGLALTWSIALLLISRTAPAAHAQAVERHFRPPIAATTQPTSGAFSQPTAGASTPIVPATNVSMGSNGLAIATTLGCIAGVLGLAIGSVALIALLRGGYGPFLRTLLPGAKRRAARDSRSTSRARRPAGRPASSYVARDGRDPAGPPRRASAPRHR